VFDVYENSRTISVGEVELRVADHGSVGDPVVLLVHGWPNTAALWTHQIPFLVARGYRVLAPDMRGQGGSGRPDTVDGYRISALIPDLVGVLNDAGVERAHVVGHDWGALCTWMLTIMQPARVRSLTALSVGHPSAFGSGGLEQMKRSWYMLLFQFEGIAEKWLSANDWANFRRFVGNHPETDNWISELSRDGALESSLKTYRANARPENLLREPRPLPPVSVPTMGLWSTEDFALTEGQMAESSQYIEAEWRYERIEGAGHWMQLDVPDKINDLVGDWIVNHSD
jgi:pimeloyl-ACP methyl ester carboxylesterase